VVRDWLVHLRAKPAETGNLRSASTVHSAARSAQAFCNWLVRQGYLERTPFVKGTIPKVGYHPIQIVEPEAIERLAHACGPSGEVMDHATVRNRALLWLLLDTGLLLSEVCTFRLRDLDRGSGRLTITESELKERQIPLGENSFRFLLEYLDQSRLTRGEHLADEVPLFLSETGQPLTPNAITLLLVRLSQRAGMAGKGVTASRLRDPFAVRYLQQGGHPHTLQKLLGLSSRAALKRYQEAARAHPHSTQMQNAPEDLLS
jgi:integrase/recombinase XerC